MMKWPALLFFIFISAICFAQSDTLYLLSDKKISCKILEIDDLEIKYKPQSNMNGPLYIIGKSKVIKYTLSNGFTEFMPKVEAPIKVEQPLQQSPKEISNIRQVIKFSLLSPVFSHISLGYEWAIKKSMNLEMIAGYSSSHINPDEIKLFKTGYNESSSYHGVFIKPGIKFVFDDEYFEKHPKYKYTIQGNYIKLDFAVSYINTKNMKATYSIYTPSAAVVTQTNLTNLKTIAYGGFINFGHQAVLKDVLTFDYYVGFGFTGKSEKYSNADFFTSPYSQGIYTENKNSYTSNYHGFLRMPELGLSFTSGFNIGYILPQKGKNKKS